MRLTLGFSPCPNDTFLFHALVHGLVGDDGLTFEPVIGDVEALNRKALRGELAVTKLSFAAFARVRDRYALLRSGGALGRGCGPLLVGPAPVPPESLPELLRGARVAVPGEGTTANLLLGLAWPGLGERIVMPFDRIEDAVLDGEADAGLIIHENRFTYAAKGLARWADLGAWWEGRTGLPIPLGGIVARRDLGPDVVARVDGLVRSSVVYARARPDASAGYVRAHAQAMDTEVMRRHIELYVNDFSVDLGEEGVAAAERLLRAAGLPAGEPIFMDSADVR